jgi:glycopeptide antibiotics resistance protein
VLRYVFTIVAALILYGSIYPWDFIFDPNVHPFRTLLTSWTGIRQDFPTRDFVVNITLYVPLGATGFVAFRSVSAVLMMALALSLSVEIVQAYHPLRYTSVLDCIANAAGATIGIGLAKTFSGSIIRVAGDRLYRIATPRTDGIAGMLGVCRAVSVRFLRRMDCIRHKSHHTIG